MAIPKKRHVHPYRATKLSRPLKTPVLDDPGKMDAVVDRWSSTMRNANSYISEDGRKVTRLLDSEDIAGALAETALNQTYLPQFIWTLRVVRVSRKIAMGIRLGEKAKKLNHLFYVSPEDPQHSNGHYVVTTDGWMFSREKNKHDSVERKSLAIAESH